VPFRRRRDEVDDRFAVLTAGRTESLDESDGWLDLVDRLAAGRAVPTRLERRAARGMRQRLGALAAGAPVRQQAESAGELAAGLGQLVLEPAGALAVRRRDQERLPFEVTQALGEDARRDAVNVLDQLVKAPRAAEERVDHEKRPPVADALERPGERRVVHATIVARPP
jgi:hypothetical protein